MRRAHGQSGMTLLEVTLALALTGAVLGGAMAFYEQALDVRRTLSSKMQLIEAERLIMARITSELRSAMSYPFLGIGMEGQGEEMRFINSTVPGPAVWAILDFTEDPLPPEQDLRLVGYGLQTYEDEETGELVIVGLQRSCQKILAVAEAEEGDEIETTLLTDRIRFVAFRYWQDGVWLESWSGGDLPLAVEITMGAKPLPEETPIEEYPYPVFRRVVYLPGAAPSRGGSAVWGLGGGRG